jgi:hypothetical protein
VAERNSFDDLRRYESYLQQTSNVDLMVLGEFFD